MITEKMYFYPVWLRIWHGINALGILILIITGISLHWSGAFTLIDFKSAVIFHNIAGFTVTLSYILFILGNILTPNGFQYQIKLKGLGKKNYETKPLLSGGYVQE